MLCSAFTNCSPVLLWLCSSPSELSHPVIPLKEGVHCSGKQTVGGMMQIFILPLYSAKSVLRLEAAVASLSQRAVTTSACVALKMWVLWSRGLYICTLFWGVMESEEVSSFSLVYLLFLWELIKYSALTFLLFGFLLLEMSWVIKDKSFSETH